ncbi:Lpg1974 family pore-forming outer membrane protein [Legionella septentrionalis]
MGSICTPGSVTTPCAAQTWSFGIEALYLRPAYSDDFAWAGTVDQIGVLNTSEVFIANNPNWMWSFKLQASYNLATGNDLNLNWYHLGNKKTTYTVVNVFPGVIGGPLTETDLNIIEPTWDAINLEFGQKVNFGEFKNIRFHAGAQFANITMPITFIAEVLSPTFGVYGVGNIGFNSKYRGFGPRFGLDMNYDLNSSLGVYGNVAAAVLAGTSKVNAASAITFINSPTALRELSAKRTLLVPEVETRLGVRYVYAWSQGELALNLGYMWTYYHGPLFSNFEIDSGDSDFAIQGPEIGLKWIGNFV